MRIIFEQSKFDLLRADVRRRAKKHGLSGKKAWTFFLREPQNRTLMWHRLREAATSKTLRRCFDRFYLRSSRRSGLELNTRLIGGGMILPHWGRIVLNAESIGNDIYSLHNVTVGNDYVSGCPALGNDVFLGVGSCVLGSITIGDHVIVAAGSVVLQDVPPCSVVAGNPARVVREILPNHISRMIGY